MLTAKEKKFGAVSSYAGSEVFISLVDAKVAPYNRQLSQLNITALCTNRHLPIQMPISVGDTDLATELYSPVASHPLGRWSDSPDRFDRRGRSLLENHQPFVSELSFAARCKRR